MHPPPFARDPVVATQQRRTSSAQDNGPLYSAQGPGIAPDAQQVEVVMGKEPAPQSSDGVERHKQRASIACLQCRSRKRRCDGQKPTCSKCVSGQSACHYPTVQKRRGAGKSKQRITVLENRLLMLESKLRDPHLTVDQPEHGSHDDLAHGQSFGSPGKAPESRAAAQTSIGVSQTQEFTNLSDPSPLSRQPLFRETTERIATLRASECAGSFRMTVTSPVAPGNAELSWVEHCLEEICKEFPICNTREVLGRVRNQGAATREACGSASRWVCLNAIIALSVHVKTAKGAFKELAPFAWAYFKNAYAAFPELVLQGNDLETAKALVLMALFGRNSADARTTSLLLSTALRLSQTLNPSLFRLDDSRSLDAMESERARSALWAAFVLDAEMSLCCGFGCGLGAGDIDIDLPNERYPHDGDKEACAGIFRRRVELALIHSAVRTRLYSRDAFKMRESELLSTIDTLNQSLKDWRQNLPSKAHPDQGGGTMEPHCVILHLAFHNLVSMVHWAARRHSSWHVAPASGLEKQSWSLINLSRLKVRAAAQHTLRLLRQSPSEQFAQFWRNLCYLLTAAMTLVLYILDCPEDPDAEADVQLLKGFGREIRRIQNEGDVDISKLLEAYQRLEQLANIAITQAQAQAQTEASQDAFPHRDAQTSKELLSSATHPMYLAQGLLTNLPNRDSEISQSLARILGMPLMMESKPYGQLVPACMKPETYGLGFAART